MKIKLFIAICFVIVVSFDLVFNLQYHSDISDNRKQIVRNQKPDNQTFRLQSSDFSSLSSEKSGDVSLIVTGDVLLARTVNYKMVKANDFTAPFAKTAGFLKSSDLTLVNLETPLIQGCPLTNDGMIFCGDPRGVLGLKYAGIDLVGIVNNHILNQGAAGKEETVKILEENNLKVLDEAEPVIVNIKNKKIGFLAYDDTKPKVQDLSSINFDDLKTAIINLKKKVDYLIVFFHWGTEYTYDPNPRQIKLAHLVIDNGGDLVLGNHPHWVQTTEKYKDKLIVYSHGNFIFDQMWSLKTRQGVVGKYIFDKRGLKEAKFYPILIEDYWQPRFMNNIE